jgi:predicted nucleic acid-binding protein
VIIVDTNVVSELMKTDPSPSVQGWVQERERRELRLTAITVAEVLYGIERLPKGRRKTSIRREALEVFGRFAEEILAFDAAAAPVYAEIVDRRDRLGAPISGYDAQIAAICRVHRASLATRNTKDFENTGVEVVNPWTA